MEPTEHFGIHFWYIRRLFQSWVSPFNLMIATHFSLGRMLSQYRQGLGEVARSPLPNLQREKHHQNSLNRVAKVKGFC